MIVILRIVAMAFRDYKAWFLAGYVSVFGAALFALAIPRVLGAGVNRMLTSEERDPSLLLLLAGVLLLAGAARGLFAFGQGFVAEALSQKVAYDIRNAFFDRLQNLSFAFHDRQTTGALMSRATADVEGVRMFLNMGAIRSGFILFMFLGVAVGMVVTNPQLAAVSLAFVPFLAFRAVTTSRRLRRIWLDVQELMAQMVSVLQENLSGIRVVKAFAAEAHEKRRFHRESRQVADRTFAAEWLWAKNYSLMNFGFTVAIGVILWVGGTQVMNGKELVDGRVVYSGMTPGDLTAFLFFMGLLVQPVRMLGWIVNSFSRAASCGARVFEILDAESPVAERPGAAILERVHGAVAFENVSFAYDGLARALRNVTVEVPIGQTIALVGRPGSGKTTFAHLIPRFYDVTDGRVTIDGADIRDATLASLRSNVGIVQQDVFIHTLSLRENVAYGDVDAPLECIAEAAKVAQMHDFIAALPDDYDTVVGERGIGLSGGQRQRLAIARTLLLDPPILILDDCTSSVDVHTERQIHQAIEAIIRDRTAFVITNRMTTIRSADLILVFKDGTIVERGTYDELLTSNGEFRNLHDSQLRPHDDDALDSPSPSADGAAA